MFGVFLDLKFFSVFKYLFMVIEFLYEVLFFFVKGDMFFGLKNIDLLNFFGFMFFVL